jgi:hypothetical protein
MFANIDYGAASVRHDIFDAAAYLEAVCGHRSPPAAKRALATNPIQPPAEADRTQSAANAAFDRHSGQPCRAACAGDTRITIKANAVAQPSATAT